MVNNKIKKIYKVNHILSIFSKKKTKNSNSFLILLFHFEIKSKLKAFNICTVSEAFNIIVETYPRMISIDEEFSFCPPNPWCNGWRIEFVINPPLALTLFLQEVGTTCFSKSFYTGRGFLAQSKQSKWFIVTST